MRRWCLCTTAILAMSTLGSQADAIPIAIDLPAFSASATVIDFNSIPNEQLITNQYAGQGVSFSGALHGLTNPGDTRLFPSNGGGTIASNWLYSASSPGGLSFTAAFAAPIVRVGFYLENWPNQTAVVELFSGAVSLGSLALNTISLTAEFKGIEESAGFDRLVFTNSTTTNGYFAVDDVRFDAVPEPGTLLLLASGLTGIALRRRRRNG